jgi:DNA modification methylase
MEINTIYNCDCVDAMKQMIEDNQKVNLILTSPPYNTGRNVGSDGNKDARLKNHETRYDVYYELKGVQEYSNWTKELFLMFDKILDSNGCILYNMSYGNENPTQMILTMADILKDTEFTMADIIVWKKYNAIPNNVSPNKLTRLCEFVFVLCRKSEYATFYMNKKVKSVSDVGQSFYENIFNIIETKNNDGATDLNKATYSSELCEKLLKIYAPKDAIVYDPFMGTGTTAVACKKMQYRFVGSEISKEQCEYANKRIDRTLINLF